MKTTSIDVYNIAKEVIQRNQGFYSKFQGLAKSEDSIKRSATGAGRFSETQIMHVLKKEIPEKYQLITGFIEKDGAVSPQLDIIVAKKGLKRTEVILDGVGIINHERVIGAIEVKNCEYVLKDLAQMQKLRNFSINLPLWIVWVTFQFAQKNCEEKVKAALDRCEQIGVNGAIVGAYRDRRAADKDPVVIPDSHVKASPNKVYELNPYNSFGKLIEFFKK